MPTMRKIPCAVYRGGTSRGVLFQEENLPFSEEIRTRILLNIFGSGDARQVDGLGGGASVTSKAMIVGTSKKAEADVEMLFAQVGIDKPIVEWKGTCGNLTSAVGQFAIDQGLVTAVEPVTQVRIYSINTKKFVTAQVPVRNGCALSSGEYAIPGVRGSGARIDLTFLDPAGAVTGELFPTGQAMESVELANGHSVRVSVVDAGNLFVFCDSRGLGISGTELPVEIEKRQDLLERLEEVRSIVAERLGIVVSREEASKVSPGTPKIGFIAASAPYRTLNNRVVEAEEIDIVARLMSAQPGIAHRSYMAAGAICTGVAAQIEGTVVHSLCNKAVHKKGTLRIGHPQGVMDVSVKAKLENGRLKIESATIARTARRIMEGSAFVPDSCFETAIQTR